MLALWALILQIASRMKAVHLSTPCVTQPTLLLLDFFSSVSIPQIEPQCHMSRLGPEENGGDARGWVERWCPVM